MLKPSNFSIHFCVKYYYSTWWQNQISVSTFCCMLHKFYGSCHWVDLGTHCVTVHKISNNRKMTWNAAWNRHTYFLYFFYRCSVMIDNLSSHFQRGIFFIFFNLSTETFTFFGEVRHPIFSYITVMLLIQKLWGKYISLWMNETSRLEKRYFPKQSILLLSVQVVVSTRITLACIFKTFSDPKKFFLLLSTNM